MDAKNENEKTAVANYANNGLAFRNVGSCSAEEGA